MSIKYIQDDNGNFYTDENGNLLTVDVSGEGGGQMLYRHDITLCEGSDHFDMGITIINTSSVAIDTIESVKNTVGLGTTINATGTYYGYSEGAVCSITFFDNYMTVNYGLNNEYSDDYANLNISINDTITEIGIAGGGSGSGTLLVETTYDELKALRDRGQLVAGQKYRITDYVATTTQENTKSAGHAFDIIVEALSNNTLSENASAIQHAGGGIPQFKPEVLADSEGNLVEGAVVPSYYIYEDTEWTNGTHENYKAQDQFIAYTYMENNDGVVVPVIYKTDTEGAINAPEEYDYPDREDAFFYEGTMEVDGTTYDKWRKIVFVEDSGLTWDGTGKAWALTNVVVTTGGSVSDPYFANSKLSAWEIKYSLDNDKTRFWWALDGQGIVGYDGELFTRQPSFDGQNPTENDQYSKYYYAWGTQLGVDDGDPMNFLYSENETIKDGETVAVGDYLEQVSVVSGKGVIYYMKDEYNNGCPYDFKNIQFKRWATDEEVANDDKFYSSWANTGNAFRWCYTFMANGTTNDTWADASTIKPYRYFSDAGDMPCFNNTIKPFIQMYEGNEETNSYEGIQWLNNIVLYGSYEDEPIFSENYEYNYVQCPCENSFGINNYSMTLGKAQGCISNTFGYKCFSTTFGGNSSYNTFGNNCGGNTFGEYFVSNTFGNGCNSNTFGNSCETNTFGNNCSGNTFGDICSYNTFGNNCNSNTFGYNCGGNIVDTGVSYAQPQPTTGTKEMTGVHIHFGVTGQFTVTRGVGYAQDVRTANDVTITV